MKLTTDLLVKKWKPNFKGERASCGQNLYFQGYSNGTRSWVYRLQILDGTKQKSIWLKIGHPVRLLLQLEAHGIAVLFCHSDI